MNKRITVFGGLAGGVLIAIAIAVGLVLGNRDGDHFVQTRRTPRSSYRASAVGSGVTERSEPSTTLAPTTTTATTTIEAPSPQAIAPPTPTSPWQVSATSGLTNLATVTITASGIPPATYYVGQCPAGRAPSLDTCILNDVVTVTDGTLNSTVRAFWWLKNVNCGRAPGACVVGAMNARTAVTVASFAISFDPARRPTVTVTPDASLTDGQSVVVRGVDVGEGSVEIEQCLLPYWASCTYVTAQSRPDGAFEATMPVYRRLEWGGHGAGSGICGVDGDCVVEVRVKPKGLDSQRIWINPDQPVGLRFAAVSPPTSTTITTLPRPPVPEGATGVLSS